MIDNKGTQKKEHVQLFLECNNWFVTEKKFKNALFLFKMSEPNN